MPQRQESKDGSGNGGKTADGQVPPRVDVFTDPADDGSANGGRAQESDRPKSRHTISHLRSAFQLQNTVADRSKVNWVLNISRTYPFG